MPHLRSVGKGTFLLERVSPMRANYMVKFSLKFRSFRGRRLPVPPPGRCPGPTGGLKAAPKPHAFGGKKSTPPLTRTPGSAPAMHGEFPSDACMVKNVCQRENHFQR